MEQGINNSAKVAAHYQFDPRQSSYYRQAAEFLGLVTFGRARPPGAPIRGTGGPAVRPYREDIRYELTDLGSEYVTRPADERRKLLAGLLANFPPMRAVLELPAKAGARGVSKKQAESDETPPSFAAIAELIERHSDIHKTTPARRASTLLAWLCWLQDATGAVDVTQTGFTLRQLRTPSDSARARWLEVKAMGTPSLRLWRGCSSRRCRWCWKQPRAGVPADAVAQPVSLSVL